MKYVAKYVCSGCGHAVPITDEEEAKKVNESFETFQGINCEMCGKKTFARSASELAALDKFYYCYTKEDFEMTDKCPNPDCDCIDKCHRIGFFKRGW